MVVCGGVGDDDVVDFVLGNCMLFGEFVYVDYFYVGIQFVYDFFGWFELIDYEDVGFCDQMLCVDCYQIDGVGIVVDEVDVVDVFGVVLLEWQ